MCREYSTCHVLSGLSVVTKKLGLFFQHFYHCRFSGLGWPTQEGRTVFITPANAVKNPPVGHNLQEFWSEEKQREFALRPLNTR
jgi:hypothetical protein